MNTRFVITYINSQGLRQLAGANQGRFHNVTRAGAESRMAELVNSTSFNDQVAIYGRQVIGTFEVREAECYDHGDLKSIYFPLRDGELPLHPGGIVK
jgi:hypothetical protein